MHALNDYHYHHVWLSISPCVVINITKPAMRTHAAHADKNKQAAPERTRQEPHGRHATATPEGSLVDFAEEKQCVLVAHLQFRNLQLCIVHCGCATLGCTWLRFARMLNVVPPHCAGRWKRR